MTRRFSSMRRNLRVALPLAVLATGARLLQSGVLAAHAAASLARIGVGFLISCAAGIALAGRWRGSGWWKT